MTSAAPESNPPILIVEDDPAIQKMLGRCLRLEGQHHLLAPDLPEARTLLEQSGGLQLILLDFNLPAGPGLGLLPLIQQRHPQATVVLMSGVGDEDLIEQAFQQGVKGHLCKPFEIDQLMDTLRQHLTAR